MRAGMKAKPPAWIIVFIFICSLIELAQWIAPAFGYGYARSAAAFLGGFWSPVFWTGQGQYYGQPLVMFVSYGVLHGGIIHLAMNMLSLLVVGRELGRFLRASAAVLIYVMSQISAALLFAILAPESGPMVGASGAVFGMAGALLAQAGKWRWRRSASLAPVWKAAGLIAGINVALTFAVPNIAWQAHLGGVLCGLLLGALLPCHRPQA